MDTIIDIFKQFKVAIIVSLAAILLLILSKTLFPVLQQMNANKTPVVEIVAENPKTYVSTEEILLEDFTVTAIHEDGARTSVDLTNIEISRTGLNPIGDTTTVTITYKPDTAIYCNVDLKVQRDKIMGFQCGYPDVKNVIAVLYSNGELCFEGEGDTLTFEEGNYPWQKYEGNNEHPITSVTFEDTVRPRVMDYWFEGMQFLSYIDTIPDSVQSMKKTFYGCTSITTMADWTGCNNLLDITECYSGCANLKYTVPVPEHVTRGANAFLGCVLLQKTPNLSTAKSLVNCSGMFQNCTKLVSITMPPNVTNIAGMFGNCINLQIMPSIPDTTKNMNAAFSGCTALKTLSDIPYGVNDMDSCFSNCEFIEGECTINASPEKVGSVFSGACTATSLDLNGSSLILDAFANTSQNGNITVNGKPPIAEITSLESYYTYKETLEKEKLKKNNSIQ